VRRIYKCTRCGGVILTLQECEGTVPPIIACRAKESCRGMMEQRPALKIFAPTHVWVRRDPDADPTMTLSESDYARQGGLFLRSIYAE
jgi:hypothetical protein